MASPVPSGFASTRTVVTIGTTFCVTKVLQACHVGLGVSDSVGSLAETLPGSVSEGRGASGLELREEEDEALGSG